MKRLLILVTLAVVTASTSGCWHWFNRGASCNTCNSGGDGYLPAPGVSQPMYDMPGPG